MSTVVNLAPFYTPPDMGLWSGGRIDDVLDPAARRLHQVVSSAAIESGNKLIWHPSDSPALEAGSARYAFLGFKSDEGVRRNLGRIGAVEGPIALRTAMRNLPLHLPESVRLYDAGDIAYHETETSDPLTSTQHALASAIQLFHEEGIFPIVFGGGHEVGFGHGLGVYQSFHPLGQRVGIINWDAHFDLRPVSERGVSSGTPFLQLANWCQENSSPFNYLCLGIKHTANTRLLFETAQKVGAAYVLADDFLEANLGALINTLDAFLEKVDVVYMTVCLDVFHVGVAPGVSAVNPDGIHPGPLFVRLFDRVMDSKKVRGLDIAELSPRYDAEDKRTSMLAARIIHRAIHR